MRKIKNTAILFLFLYATSANSDTPEEILNKSKQIKTDLQSLSETGMRCDLKLTTLGLNALKSEDCTQYNAGVTNIYFNSAARECPKLLEWYLAQLKFIKANPNVADTNKPLTQKLHTSMKAVKTACDTDQYEINYPYLTKPMNHIQSLNKMQN